MRYVPLFALILFSCTGRKLTMADLNVPDPEREGIVRNRVKEMLGVPSMRISRADTTVRNTYDEVGRALMISPYPGNRRVYHYDSANLPDSMYRQDWDVWYGYRIQHTFDEDQNILYSYYYDPDNRDDRYVEKLMFDRNGRLARCDLHYLHHSMLKNIPAYKTLNGEPEVTTMYFYDDRSRLVKDSCHYSNTTVHKYYYSQQLDSMIFTESDLASSYNEERTYYNAAGLRKSTKAVRRRRQLDSADSSEISYTISYSYKKW